MLESRVPFLSFCKKEGLWKATQAGRVLLMTRSASLMSSGVNLWKAVVLAHRDWPRRGDTEDARLGASHKSWGHPKRGSRQGRHTKPRARRAALKLLRRDVGRWSEDEGGGSGRRSARPRPPGCSAPSGEGDEGGEGKRKSARR